MHKLIGDVLVAFGAQGVSFICSCATTLLVPKVLGVEEYGYWQLFIFYTSYVTFTQFGLNDGVYLEHGGETRKEIDKGLIVGEMRVGLSYQAVVALLISLAGVFYIQEEKRITVIIAEAIFLILCNTTNYLSYVFQAMGETRLASVGFMMNRGSFLIPLAACILLNIQEFEVYVFWYISAQALALFYCLWKASDFLKAEPLSFSRSISKTFCSMKKGIVLTVANIASMLIMGSARFIIDATWGINAFGEVSLSLLIVNFIIVFISQVAMVLFPALRFAGEEKIGVFYETARNVLAATVPAVIILYVPAKTLISLWLPQYSDSLKSLVYLFPVCLFEIQTNLVVITILKVRSDVNAMLAINAVACGVTFALQLLAVAIFHSTESVLLASLMGIVLRNAIGDSYISKLYNSNNYKILLEQTVLTALFIACSEYLQQTACLIACLMLIVCHCWLCKKELAVALGVMKHLFH